MKDTDWPLNWLEVCSREAKSSYIRTYLTLATVMLGFTYTSKPDELTDIYLT